MTSSGVFDAPAAWGSTVTERIRAAGGLVVADEVQYGFRPIRIALLGVRAARHLTGHGDLGQARRKTAIPWAVVIANRSLIEAFQAQYGFFSTFGGNPVAAAAGLAVLDVLERERLMENALTTGKYLRQELESLAVLHPCLGAVRGAGLLLGLEVLGPDVPTAKRRTKQIINSLAARARVLIGYEGPLVNLLKIRAVDAVSPRACGPAGRGDRRGGGRDRRALGADQPLEFGYDLEQIADESDVGHLEDRGFAVLVDGDDGACVLDAGQVLDGAGDADGEVDFGRDDFACLADPAFRSRRSLRRPRRARRPRPRRACRLG